MKKDLRFDAFLWVVVLIVAAAIAFGLLRRDAARSFGALAFGSFPSFEISAVDKGPFNAHMLKGHVWAVHTASSDRQLMGMAARLCEIEKRTASGQRHLYVLSFATVGSVDLKPIIPFHYIAKAEPAKREALFSGFGYMSDETVLLVDQNGIIRGKYNFEDIQGFKDFEQNMLRIL